jgi:DNA-directed RNA polymerase specialized sigma24 family protein
MSRPVSDQYAHVDAALEVWARVARDSFHGIGWPARTLLARVIEQGANGAAHSAGVSTSCWPELAEQVERAILRLGDIRRQVVVTHALYGQPAEVCARYCRMTIPRYRTLLAQCRRSIGDYLAGCSDRQLMA